MWSCFSFVIFLVAFLIKLTFILKGVMEWCVYVLCCWEAAHWLHLIKPLICWIILRWPFPLCALPVWLRRPEGGACVWVSESVCESSNTVTGLSVGQSPAESKWSCWTSEEPARNQLRSAHGDTRWVCWVSDRKQSSAKCMQGGWTAASLTIRPEEHLQRRGGGDGCFAGTHTHSRQRLILKSRRLTFTTVLVS